jgi:hypothetical protein
MQSKSKPFYIFPYIVDGVQYVEAYPIHGGEEYNTSIPSFRLITLKPSRNQARKLAYKLWINPTGKGYNRFPFSPTSDNFYKYYKMNPTYTFKEHWG